MELLIFGAITSILVLGWRVFAKRPAALESGSAQFTELTDMPSLQDFFESTDGHPKLLFLYDPWCPVSALATRHISQIEASVSLINVSSQRNLSYEVERRTGVIHESPQALVIRNEVAIWSASHYAIDSSTAITALGTFSTL